MDGLEITILSEVGQIKTNTYDITCMWNLKYDTNELIYKTETFRYRKQLIFSKGEMFSSVQSLSGVRLFATP